MMDCHLGLNKGSTHLQAAASVAVAAPAAPVVVAQMVRSRGRQGDGDLG